MMAMSTRSASVVMAELDAGVCGDVGIGMRELAGHLAAAVRDVKCRE
jgi:hypothetical protein